MKNEQPVTILIGIEYDKEHEIFIVTHEGHEYIFEEAYQVENFRDEIFWGEKDISPENVIFTSCSFIGNLPIWSDHE